MNPRFPLLLQVNARLLLRSAPGASLATLPDRILDRWSALGVQWLYLLGVWRLGEAGPAISRADPAILAGGRAALADFTQADIVGSCFAVTGYDVASAFGGDEALATLRRRLADRGIRLMLDFIPNHTAPDHRWVREDPDLFVNGDQAQRAADPRNWREVGDRVLALGRDPYFDGWADTLQLDYANPRTQALMSDTLAGVARRCDGVRADMAMLVLPDIIRRTWHRAAEDFWPAAITHARNANPAFTLLAEVYWGLECALLERGFDYAYDKTFYDAVVARDPSRIRQALAAPLDRQARMARFIENHDEPRAASLFDWPQQRAATAVTFFAPGLRFLHEGQIERAVHHLSMHLARIPPEPPDPGSIAFHEALLAILPRDGEVTSLTPEPAWSENPSHQNFVVLLWRQAPGILLICINDADTRGQCRVRVDFGPGQHQLADQLGPERYQRDGTDMARNGLYLDLPGWGLNAFAVGASTPNLVKGLAFGNHDLDNRGPGPTGRHAVGVLTHDGDQGQHP